MLLEDLQHHLFRSRDNLPLLPAHFLHQFPHQIRLWWQVSRETARHSFPTVSSKTSQKTISFRFVRIIISIYSYSRKYHTV